MFDVLERENTFDSKAEWKKAKTFPTVREAQKYVKHRNQGVAPGVPAPFEFVIVQAGQSVDDRGRPV